MRNAIKESATRVSVPSLMMGEGALAKDIQRRVFSSPLNVHY
ncbi:MAG: hypothetical protein KatS3mg057_0119 [Herpetosiphonaceae bacterium]|nr:MAG: hypothetical protein KatS3mg057_0119 [Herpetosiphonaceae bacterium]